MYFNAEDGVTLVNFCFDCIAPQDRDNPEAMAAYLRPVEKPPDPRILAIQRGLSRSELAICFLYDTLSGLTGPALPSPKMAASALAIFANNFPEFTGRICPAPCEEACTLNLENQPVTIKTIEQAIADKAWEMGFVKPEPSEVQTGKRVAVIGSGPAGMAAAQQLARAGHEVHVFERQAKPGGLLRYGIPDFKMEKYHIDRRVKQMEAEGEALKDAVAPWFGTLFWVVGALSLFAAAMGIVDYTSRVAADVLKVSYLRQLSESKIYFGLVWGLVLIGCVILLVGFDQPLTLLVISACVGGMMMFIYSILLLVRRYFGRRERLIMVALALLSLGVSIWLVRTDQPGAFYLLHSRAWELLLGALLALGVFPAIRSRLLAGALGLVGLALAMFFLLLVALSEHIAFAEEHEFDDSYSRSWLALVFLYTGRWDEAALLAQQLVRTAVGAISRISALIALGRLRARRGDPGAREVLDEALEIALRALTTGPARVLGMDLPADDWIAIDPDASWVASADALATLGKNTPLLGRELRGRVVLAAVGGELRYD